MSPPPGDTHVTGPLTPASPLEEETLKQETSDEVSPSGSDLEKAFNEFWSAYPHKVEERGARAIFCRLIRKGEATVSDLVSGARAYAAAVTGRELKHVKYPTTWLTKGCWTDAIDETAVATTKVIAAPPAFAGPYDVWLSIAARKGSSWTVSWIDPCGWDDDLRALQPRTGFAAKRLVEEIGPLLREMGITISEPKRVAA